MKKINILYWVFTILYAGVIIATSIGGLTKDPKTVEMMVTQMGYPNYFPAFISVAKILGAIALLIPGFPRIKEWAYAGLFFDLIAAVYSFIALGYPAKDWLPMFLFFAVLGASYYLYHKRQTLMASAK